MSVWLLERRHKCAAPGCRRIIGPRRLMCARHWSRVPRALQCRVYGAWTGQPTRRWRLAPRAATAALLRQGELFDQHDLFEVPHA